MMLAPARADAGSGRAGQALATSVRVRQAGLDCVRGIAALLVVLIHFSEFLEKHGRSASWQQLGHSLSRFTCSWIDFGKIGIAAFFLVSGAVVPHSLPDSSSPGPRLSVLGKFAVGRFFRLYPSYWTSLVLAVLLGWSMVSGADVLVNVTMLQRFLGVQDALGVYWTLQIELIFYAACAALYATGQLHRLAVQAAAWRLMLGVALLAALARYFTGHKLPVALPLALALMFFACRYRRSLLGMAESRSERPSLANYALLLIGLLAICLLAYSRDYGFNETWYRYFNSYVLGFALFRSLAGISNVRLAKPLAALGASSYALYLLHPVVGFSVLSALQGHASPALALIAALLVSLASAFAVYQLVERPGIALGKRLLLHRALPTLTDRSLET
jgi:peptidoglycan/LPS O-acetylase OafA/YrhL